MSIGHALQFHGARARPVKSKLLQRQHLGWILFVGLTLISACTAPGKAGSPLLLARATPTANVVVGVTGREVTEASPVEIPTAALENQPILLETGQRIASDGSYDKTENEGAGRVHAKVVRKREEPPGMIVRVYKQIITWGLKWSLAQIT